MHTVTTRHSGVLVRFSCARFTLPQPPAPRRTQSRNSRAGACACPRPEPRAVPFAQLVCGEAAAARSGRRPGPDLRIMRQARSSWRTWLWGFRARRRRDHGSDGAPYSRPVSDHLRASRRRLATLSLHRVRGLAPGGRIGSVALIVWIAGRDADDPAQGHHTLELSAAGSRRGLGPNLVGSLQVTGLAGALISIPRADAVQVRFKALIARASCRCSLRSIPAR